MQSIAARDRSCPKYQTDSVPKAGLMGERHSHISGRDTPHPALSSAAKRKRANCGGHPAQAIDLLARESGSYECHDPETTLRSCMARCVST